MSHAASTGEQVWPKREYIHYMESQSTRDSEQSLISHVTQVLISHVTQSPSEMLLYRCTGSEKMCDSLQTDKLEKMSLIRKNENP